jgi:IS30 family transposase
MAEGYGNSEACGIVGVNRATGQRWLYGRRDRPRQLPAPAPAPPASDRFLSADDRIVIADLLRAGRSVRSIAAELGRSPSTVCREVRRNAEPGSGEYRPYAAQARAEARRGRPKQGKIASSPELAALIQGMLARRYSPEQISRRLRRDHPDRPELHVTHETIYQALYVQGRGELRRELARALRTGRAVRKPRRKDDQRQSRFTHPMVMISQRPAEAADRAVPGHWEGDLIIGAGHQSAIGTLVERTTRYVLLVHLGRDHTAAHVRDALAATITTLPAHLRRSLTWDQGGEMACHAAFTIATGMPVYFCDPHSPWQRGSNENTNGLLRQYFPKGSNLAIHTPADLAAVAAELNGRPRKTLGWDTPAERLAKILSQTS